MTEINQKNDPECWNWPVKIIPRIKTLGPHFMHNHAIKTQVTLNMHVNVDLPALAFDTSISSRSTVVTFAVTLIEPKRYFHKRAAMD